MPAAVTQFRWDYVMESGVRALTLALALRLPGDYPPLGAGGTTGCKSVTDLLRHSLAYRFPFISAGAMRRRPFVRWGVRESVADLFGHSLTAKGGNGGCWSGCLGRSAAENQTDRRASTAFLIGPGISTAVGTGHHRPYSGFGRPG